MHRRIVFALFVLFGTANCAATGANSIEGWNVARSKHFNMYTSTSMMYGETLNGLEYHYSSLSSSFFKAYDVGNVDVLFLESDDFFEMFGAKRGYVAAAYVPGASAIGAKGLLVVKSIAQGRPSEAPTEGSALTAVGGDNAHAEGLTHIFMSRVMPKAPLWLHEGFAAYARVVEYKEGDGGQRVACFGQPGQTERTIIPLSKLFAMTWEDYDGGEARGWYKHTARMLIDYGIHGEKGKWFPASLEAFMSAGLDGTAGASALGAAFPGMNEAALDKAISMHNRDVEAELERKGVTRGLCPLGIPIPAGKAADIGDHKLEPVASAEIKALLDGLRRLPLRDDGYPAWYPEQVVASVDHK